MKLCQNFAFKSRPAAPVVAQNTDDVILETKQNVTVASTKNVRAEQIAKTVEAIDKIESTYSQVTETWDTLKSYSSDLNSLTGLSDILPSIQTVSKVAEVVIPSLVSISSSVPFAGPVVVILSQFYGSVTLALRNNAEMNRLVDIVDEAATWMNSSLKPLNYIKSSVQSESILNHLTSIEKSIQDLVHQISRCNKLMVGVAVGAGVSTISTIISLSKQVFFSGSIQGDIKSITADIESAQNKLSRYYSSFSLELFTYRTGNTRSLPKVKELRDLLDSPFVCFDQEIKEHLSRFQDGSREWMQSMVRFWMQSSKDKIFWICADAGMGKSAFVSSLVNQLQAQHSLLAVFFCRYGEKGRSDGVNIIKSIAYQIAENVPQCRDDIVKAAEAMIKDGVSSPFQLMTSLIISPLANQEKDPSFDEDNKLVLIIDALDEVGLTNSSERSSFLDLLLIMVSQLPSFVKVLITSRPEVDILAKFIAIPQTKIDQNDERHQMDLRKFISFSLKDHLVRDEDLEEATRIFYDKSEGRFIYAAMVLKQNFLSQDKKWLLEEIQNGLPDGLDDTYLSYFIKIRNQNRQMYDSTTSRLLALLVAMAEPLRFIDAMEILNVDESILETISSQIAAMFPLQGSDDNRRYQFFHKSVIDWLTNQQKSNIRKIVPFEQGLSLWLQSNFSGTSNISKYQQWVSCIDAFGVTSVNALMQMESNDWNDEMLSNIPKFIRLQIHRKLDMIRLGLDHQKGVSPNSINIVLEDSHDSDKGSNIESQFSLMPILSSLRGNIADLNEIQTWEKSFASFGIRNVQDICLVSEQDWKLPCFDHIPGLTKTLIQREAWNILSRRNYSIVQSHDFYVPVESGHQLFYTSLTEKIIGYDSESTWMFPKLLSPYLFEHLVYHMIESGNMIDCGRLIARLPWIIESFFGLSRGVADMIAQTKLFLSKAPSFESNNPELPAIIESIKLYRKCLELSLGRLQYHVKVGKDIAEDVFRDDTIRLILMELIGRLSNIAPNRMSLECHAITSRILRDCQAMWRNQSSFELVRYRLEAPGDHLDLKLLTSYAPLQVASLDNHRVLVSSKLNTVHIVDLETGYCDMSYDNEAVFDCIVVNAQYVLLVLSDKTIGLWNLTSNQTTVFPIKDVQLSLALYESMNLLFCGFSSGEIGVYNYITGDFISLLSCDGNYQITSLCLYPTIDGWTLFGGSRDSSSIFMWTSASSDNFPVRSFDCGVHVSKMTSLSSKYMAILANEKARSVVLVDIESYQPALTLGYKVRSFCCVLGKYLVMALTSEEICVYDYENRMELEKFASNFEADSVCGLEDGRVASCLDSIYDVKIWKLFSINQDSDRGIVDIKDDNIYDNHVIVTFLVTLSNTIAVSASDFEYYFYVWDLPTGDMISKTSNISPVSALCAGKDSKTVITGSDEDFMVRFWDIEDKRCVLELEGHSDMITSIVMMDEHIYCSGSFDTCIFVWDLRKPLDDGRYSPIHKLSHEYVISALVKISHNQIIAGSEKDSRLNVWNIETKEEQIIERKSSFKTANLVTLFNPNKIAVYSHLSNYQLIDIPTMTVSAAEENNRLTPLELLYSSEFEELRSLPISEVCATCLNDDYVIIGKESGQVDIFKRPAVRTIEKIDKEKVVESVGEVTQDQIERIDEAALEMKENGKVTLSDGTESDDSEIVASDDGHTTELFGVNGTAVDPDNIAMSNDMNQEDAKSGDQDIIDENERAW